MFRNFARREPVTFIAMSYFAAITLAVAIGPLFVTHDLLVSNLRMRNAAPFQLETGGWYFLGGDALGRSVLARLLVGGATTLSIAGSSMLIGFVIGVFLGIVAGMKNTWWSSLMMRALDVLMSIPSLLLAMVFLYTLGSSPLVMIGVLAIGVVPGIARVARSQTLEVRERAFISASRVMGAKQAHIIWNHITPNVVPLMLPMLALGFAGTMLAESTLTFLGIGITPPSVTWGLMVSEGRNYIQVAWWSSFWPGLLITTLALAATLIGNWYQVAADPLLRARHSGKARGND